MGVNRQCNPCYTTCTEIRGGHAQRIKVFNGSYIIPFIHALVESIPVMEAKIYIFKLIQVLRRKLSIIDTDLTVFSIQIKTTNPQTPNQVTLSCLTVSMV